MAVVHTLNARMIPLQAIVEGLRAMTKREVITYIRVSTSQQGRSGLGIEAQRQSLRQFATAEALEG